MINIKQFGGPDIDLLSLVSGDDKKNFEEFYKDGPGYCPAVVQFLNERHEQIGSFIGSKNDVFIDLGAHIGIFSLMFNKAAKRIFSLEPLAKHFSILQSMTKEFSNIFPLQMAMGTENKQTKLFIDNVNNTQTALIQHKDSREFCDVFSVSLETFCHVFGIKQIDFLKVDIEGFELPLILDYSFDNISTIIKKMHVEIHNIEMGPMKNHHSRVSELVCEKLRYLGFKLFVNNDEIFAWK